ncbi:hypothetical protein POTOM_038456 [Populus tomentosa]|uniref:Uncharacterized protein n=1 Tax=Populus tomentosa TaxID=118781 RepID=A0A8X8CL25_POPTO|nr:hypothetical protein POTOM_038456 [Populus tomentosa]
MLYASLDIFRADQLHDSSSFLGRGPIVQAADSLLKLVSELKQTSIFSGLASLNDHVGRRIDEFDQLVEKTDSMLARDGEAAAAR